MNNLRILKNLSMAMAGAAMFALGTGKSAQAITLTRSVEPFAVDYVFFSTEGNGLTIDILGNGFTGGSNGVGLSDSMIRVLEDDGSNIGALTGNNVAVNDDSLGFGDGSTSIFDSFLNLPSLVAGDYILAVGQFLLTELEARTGIASTPDSVGDYQVTFTGDASISQSVPEPTSLFGLLAIGAISSSSALKYKKTAS